MTTPSPADGLRECLALLEKATPGEWRWSPNGNIVPAHYTDDCEIAAVYSEHMDDVDVPDNAAAIIAAVNFLRDHGPALATALRLREGWMPEESAPNDGTKFLALTHFGDIEINQWCSMGNFRWEHVEGNTYRKVEEAPSEFWNGNSFTHWMPLPAPPTADDLARILEQPK